MTLITKPCPVGNLGNGDARGQKPSRMVDAHHGLVLMRRNSHLPMEDAHQVIRAQVHEACQGMYRSVLLRIGVQPISDSPDRRLLASDATEYKRRREMIRCQAGHDGE